jgi:hypothetical protein
MRLLNQMQRKSISRTHLKNKPKSSNATGKNDKRKSKLNHYEAASAVAVKAIANYLESNQ